MKEKLFTPRQTDRQTDGRTDTHTDSLYLYLSLYLTQTNIHRGFYVVVKDLSAVNQ